MILPCALRLPGVERIQKAMGGNGLRRDADDLLERPKINSITWLTDSRRADSATMKIAGLAAVAEALAIIVEPAGDAANLAPI